MEASPDTISILSPAPRIFTFPPTHNLADSPCPSPSESPFEPECKTPPRRQQHELLETAFTSTSPISPSSSRPHLAQSPQSKRRRQSIDDDRQRRPKKGDEDYVKRPENAFMLFRRHYCEDRLRVAESGGGGASRKMRQADLSKAISLEWKSLSAQERQHWQQMAEVKKKEHEEKYPNYVFRPQRARDADGNVIKNKKRVKRTSGTEPEHFTFVLPGQSIPARRSISAPTPPIPIYQTIRVPKVYESPSCPTSPSLVPLIERRSSHPGHDEEINSNFDYLPNTGVDSSFFVQDGSNDSSAAFHRTYPDVSDQSISLLQGSVNNPSVFTLNSPSSPTGSLNPKISSTSPDDFFTPLAAADWAQYCSDHLQTSGGQDFIDQSFASGYPDLSFDYPTTYNWGNTDYAAMWSTSQSVTLASDDFDINAIPGIEFGITKHPDVDGSQSLQQQCVDYQAVPFLGEGYLTPGIC